VAAVLLVFIAALCSWAGVGTARSAVPEVILSSQRVSQGDVFLLRVRAGEGETLKVSWMEREIPMVARGKGEWCAFLGVDLKSVPQVHPLKILTTPSGREKSVGITVESKDYGERRITLPREMVELDGPTLERVKRESAEMKAVLNGPPAAPLWRSRFLIPVEGEVSGRFGLRNYINGEPRSPHSGVDLKAHLGVPVRAMNHGRVVLTCDHFFSGRSVVIDHGGGIHTMYFHLEKILVEEQQRVGKGDIIGHVGSTGRSTGPHLHLGVRVNGARVDPLRLVNLSVELE
jgi:hypothetical protein